MTFTGFDELRSYEISLDLDEYEIWKEFLEPLVSHLPTNVVGICRHGFTEMVNNVMDHSEGKYLLVGFKQQAASVLISVTDNGVGIFQKIRRAFALPSDRDAMLELTKGKLTTDPLRHTGEGIFFTSRMFDVFIIQSGSVFFAHTPFDSDFLTDHGKQWQGTMVNMQISDDSPRTTREVFDRFASSEGDYAFDITEVPMLLLREDGEPLISRSQAKRLVHRFESFKLVILDFDGVEAIGQAFADEVFRVFQLEHPDVKLEPINATADVDKMIRRARARLPKNGETE